MEIGKEIEGRKGKFERKVNFYVYVFQKRLIKSLLDRSCPEFILNSKSVDKIIPHRCFP